MVADSYLMGFVVVAAYGGVGATSSCLRVHSGSNPSSLAVRYTGRWLLLSSRACRRCRRAAAPDVSVVDAADNPQEQGITVAPLNVEEGIDPQEQEGKVIYSLQLKCHKF